MIRERTDCRLCGGSLTGVFSLKPMPVANSFPDHPDTDAKRYPLELMQCGKCDHVQLRHVMTGLFNPDYKYETPKTPHLEESAKALRKNYPEAKKLLEIGSNNGVFLRRLKQEGFQALGIDPAAHPDSFAIPEAFTRDSARSFRSRFDLVVANNVFAHIDDLRDVFLGVDHVMAEGGSLVFEVQYLPCLIARGAFDCIYGEHLDYHTLKPLATFLRSVKMVMAGYELIPTHGGSIRVTVKREGPEVKVPDEPLDWKYLRDTLEAVGRELKANGKMVAFGASAKASTLINELEIEDQILYCVDDTKRKQGKYIPGTAIQIRPVEELGSEDVLLSAWNYADLIRERLPHNKLIIPFA